MQPGFPLRHLNEHARSVAEMLDKRADRDSHHSQTPQAEPDTLLVRRWVEVRSLCSIERDLKA